MSCISITAMRLRNQGSDDLRSRLGVGLVVIVAMSQIPTLNFYN